MSNESNEYRDRRIEKLNQLREEGVALWPDRFERSHTLAEAHALPEGQAEVAVCGRIVAKRVMGKRTFVKLQDLDGSFQLMISRDDLHEDVEQSKALYKQVKKLIDLWDFIGASGTTMRTKTGEPTLDVRSFVFLGKTLQSPPEKYKGSQDTELNWRRRYLDLVTNEETRARFRLRTNMVKAMRAYLDEHGFDEVETPVLCNKASGALARPFVAHHNSMNMPVVMRIAPETYLKRLIVAGYDRVYEFARCFRNEGMDASHLQDFTMLEYYASYWNYQDNMRFTREMLQHVIQQACGTLQIQRGEQTIDFGGEWPIRSLREVIQEHSGIDFKEHETAESLRAAVEAKGIELEKPEAGRGSLIDQLYKKTARQKLVQPTFIVNHPTDLSPLARKSDEDPTTVDRFQLVVDTWEVLNAYSELVDPLDQRERLEQQAALRSDGDDEAMDLDEDYLLAMEHGMPPISGWGMGIDRFVALLSDSPNLRDVVWFPLLKPEGGHEHPERAGDELLAEWRAQLAGLQGQLPAEVFSHLDQALAGIELPAPAGEAEGDS